MASSRGASSPVLLLGCDYYMVAACNRHEIPAVVAYGPVTRDGFGLPQANKNIIPVFVEDQSRAESVLGALKRAGLDELDFLAVLTSSEHSLVTAGLLGNYLGCRAIDPQVALNFRDKAIQKHLIRAAGFRVADVAVIEDLRILPPDIAVPEQGGVLKPIAGAGTAHTIMVRTKDDIERFASNQRASGSALRTFLLENYIKGRELIADGVACDGEVTFFCLGEYADTCLTTVTEQKALCMRRLDPSDDESLYAECTPIIRGALRTLGLQDGVFHMELFQENDTGHIIFSECAARRGGGLTQEEVQAKFRVNLAEQAVLRAAGRVDGIDVKICPGIIGMTYLPGRAGTLVSCPSPRDLLNLPGVRYARIDAPFGQVMTANITNTYDRIGALLLWAPDLDEFTSRIARTREWFDQRAVIIPPALTRSELSAWQRGQWPDDDFTIHLYLDQDDVGS